MKQKILRQVKITAMGIGYLLAVAAAIIMGYSIIKDEFEQFFGALFCYAVLWFGFILSQIEETGGEQWQLKFATAAVAVLYVTPNLTRTVSALKSFSKVSIFSEISGGRKESTMPCPVFIYREKTA
jgi:ABC-type uncharacterized transport system permease subunit